LYIYLDLDPSNSGVSVLDSIEIYMRISEITGTLIYLIGITLGILLFIRYNKSRSKIILYFGLASISFGFIYAVYLVQLINRLFSDPLGFLQYPYPLNTSYTYMELITYTAIGLIMIFTTYVGTELLIRRRYRFSIYIPAWILIMSWESLIFFGQEKFIRLNEILWAIYASFLVSFLIFGFLIRAIRTKGILKEKFILLSIGMLLIFLIAIETFQNSVNCIAYLFALRILVVVGLFLVNHGLRPEKFLDTDAKLPHEVGNLAYFLVGETKNLDEKFWNAYIEKSKKFIEEYKSQQKEE